MLRSIQENLKKINSRLSVYDCVSLGIIAASVALFAAFVWFEEKSRVEPVVYIPSSQALSVDARPFGSIHGSTYTYSWCSGSGQIKATNKVYFASSEEAEKSGRTLSKLCQK